MTVLIRNAAILTVDKNNTIHSPGAILIDNKRIVDVGPSDAVQGRHPNPDQVIDAGGRVVAPGFISIHNHVGYTVFRGRSEDAGLGCVTGMYFPMDTVITCDERLAIGSLTCAELLCSGVTTVLEMEESVDIYAPFVEKLGIRSAMGVMTYDVDVDRMVKGEFQYVDNLCESQLRQAIEFAEQWHGKADGRITAMMTPNMTISSSPQLIDGSRAAADRLGLRLSIHMGWRPEEEKIIRDLHGKSSFEFARDHGLLAPDVVAAHCYVVSDADKDVLQSSGAHVAHCPLMNSMRGHIATLLEYKQRAINVGLGIDNMFSDHFDVLRACVACARIKKNDPLAICAPDALELATMGSARALGMEDKIGSLEKGKLADLIVINCRTFGLTPTLDPTQNLVYHAHASDIELVMVNGQIVVKEGHPVHVESDTLVKNAQIAADSAWDKFVAKYGGVIAKCLAECELTIMH